jgi:hypothetical protein
MEHNASVEPILEDTMKKKYFLSVGIRMRRIHFGYLAVPTKIRVLFASVLSAITVDQRK